jgi:phosphohistidine swiveling domain-containing protein
VIAAAAPPRRRAAGLFLAIVCATISAMTLAPVAAAETTHLFQPATTAAFGSISGGLGLAVDESNGDVYAAALNGNSINKYTASGEPVTAFGGGSGQIPGFGSPWQLAVDQASHDLYASTESGNGVYKVDPNGNLVTAFATGGKLTVARPIGIAVNPTDGDLYVASYEESKVEVFTAAGVPVTEFSTAPVTSPLGVAVNSSGNVFVDGGGFGGPGGLARFSPSGSLESTVQEGSFQGVTIDPATGDVYASQANELFQYSPTGETLISEFGSGVINDAWGVGVDETTGQVYAATYYGSSIDVFGPRVIVADVTTDPSSSPNIEHTSAKLTGQVDLAGGPAVTECYVEYGTTTEYSDGKIPCENATPIDSSTEVSTTIGGLASLTTYHYRFVAKNENGPGFGQDQTVTPPAIFGL